MRAEHEAEAGTGAEPEPGAEPGAGSAAGAGSAGAGTTGAGTPGAGATGVGATGAGAAAPEAAKSRRFPSITKDTARPEGHGRAAPGDALAARQWPMLSVLAATAVGLLLTALNHPRFGVLVIGVALIAASVLRRVLPQVGMLAVRSRFTDMVTYGLLGVAITLLALVMEPKPWLDIPFLEDAVRFTVR